MNKLNAKLKLDDIVTMANIAEHLDDHDLGTIGYRVFEDFQRDLNSYLNLRRIVSFPVRRWNQLAEDTGFEPVGLLHPSL